MSWKGFTKAVGRLPAYISKGAGGMQGSKDEEYLAMEDQFKVLDVLARKLSSDTKLFKDSLALMLSHQTTLSNMFKELYEPICLEGENNQQVVLKSVQDFCEAMRKARDTLEGDLEQIERLVVAPTSDFLVILDQIRKVMIKRSHKLIDYDRHAESVKTMREKQNRSVGDEKRFAQLEQTFDHATRDFNSINNQLKQDLAVFLMLRNDFMDPCLLTFYNYQVRVYQTLYTIFYEVGNSQFDLSTNALDGYQAHQNEVEKLLLQITLAKPVVRSDPPAYNAAVQSNQQQASSSNRTSQETPRMSEELPRIPLEVSRDTKPRVMMVTAQYDFDAQTPGDLSFKKGESVEVVERTKDINDWWVGRIGNRQGQFPGNYVL